MKGTPVAIKQMLAEKMSEKGMKDFLAEAILMKSLPPHPNVVMFHGKKVVNISWKMVEI